MLFIKAIIECTLFTLYSKTNSRSLLYCILLVYCSLPALCQQRAPYGSSCLFGSAQADCAIGLTCNYFQTNFGNFCVCASGQFCYPPLTGICHNVNTLRADNLHLNGPPKETELSLAWDRPLNVSDRLTYRMVINGTKEITSINVTTYTLTNRQPGTPYLIQIYTSTFKDFRVSEEKIENNNPLNGTFCTKPAVPGSLAKNINSDSSVTLQFFKSDGRVESYNVTITANKSGVSENQSITSDKVVGDRINATFYNFVPGELYDVTIKAISCGLDSEVRIDSFIKRLTVGERCDPSNKDPCEANTACQDVGDHYECVLDHPSNAAGDSGVVIALGVLSAVLFIVCAVLAFCVYTMNKKLRTTEPVVGNPPVRTMSTESITVSRAPTNTYALQRSVTLNEGHSSPSCLDLTLHEEGE